MTVATSRFRSVGNAVLCSGAMLLALALYAGVLNHPFVYDDFRTVVDNGTIATLRDPLAILQHEWTRPFTNLSFAVDRALWGPAPFGFHLTNVALHIVNTMLVFVLALDGFRRTLPGEEAASRNAASTAATVAAAIFASHPIVSEAVVYISSRADLLCGCFFLLALLAATRWLEREGLWTQVLMWLAWLCALLAKETAIVFPLVLLALTPLRDIRRDGARHTVRRTVIAMHGVMLAAAAARLVVLLRVEGARVDLVSTLSSAVAAGGTYLRLLCVPAGQSVFHALTPLAGAGDLRLWTMLSIMLLGGTVMWRARTRLTAAELGVVLATTTIAPALLSSVQGTDAIAEHRLYLPAVGFSLLCASLVASMLTLTRNLRLVRVLLPLACTAIVLSLCGRTYIRTIVWSDPLNLWQEAVSVSPNHWLPSAVLGETLHARAMHADAVKEFRSSLARNPENEGTMLNLVVCLSELKRTEEASAVVTEYERRHPGTAAVFIGRGATAMIDGRPQDARSQFRHALDADPRSAMARQWLALVAEQDADPGQLLNQCYELQRLTPGRAHVDACIAQMQALQAKSQNEAR